MFESFWETDDVKQMIDQGYLPVYDRQNIHVASLILYLIFDLSLYRVIYNQMTILFLSRILVGTRINGKNKK